MAGENRRSSVDVSGDQDTHLETELLSRGRRFSFFQAVRLLRHLERAEHRADKPESDKIRVRPKLSLSFPPGDIDRIEKISNDNADTYRITATFLGLYGAASPLPTFYTEDLLSEKNEDETVSRDFIDIVHHRLYALFYKGWLKYRQFFQVVEEQDNDYIERLFCLLGLGEPDMRDKQGRDYALLRYLGLFTQFPRSAVGLATLIRDALNGPPVEVIQCIYRRAVIPETQRLKMGAGGNSLGRNSYLGKEIDDRMGKFRIQLGPLNQADFLRFTPGNEGYDKLVLLTELFITDPLAYEVELILAANQAKTASLGDPVRAVLGVTTWVFSKTSLGEVRTRFVVNRS